MIDFTKHSDEMLRIRHKEDKETVKKYEELHRLSVHDLVETEQEMERRGILADQ